MLARVAESLYWMARSLERAETGSRLLEVSHAMALELGLANGAGRSTIWEPLVRITGDLDRFLANHHRANRVSVGWFLTFSSANPNSIVACVRRARENAHAVRDRLPTDVWEALNSLHLAMGDWPPQRIAREGVYGFCQHVRAASHLVQGLADQGMRHDEAWEFIRLGRHLERAEKSARLLEVKFHLLPAQDPAVWAPLDLHQWRALLSSAAAEEAYWGVDPSGLDPRAVVRLLVVDERFPRAVAYCLAEVERALRALVEAGVMAPAPAALRLVRAARAAVSTADALSWDRDLGRLLDEVQIRCNSIDEAIAADCFGYPGNGHGGSQRAQAARQAQN